MAASDLLRLAWEADHDGRAKLRDSLLTMAVVESAPGDPWAERCRTRLLSDRPDHFLSQFPTVSQALADPRVVQARDKFRVKYPDARVHSLLLKACARRGPYLGRVESLEAMIEDLAGPSAEAENVRRDAPQLSRGPLSRQRVARPLAFALSYPPMASGLESSRLDPPPPEVPDSHAEPAIETSAEDFSLFYVTILLAIAFLLASVQTHQESQTARH